MRYARNSDPLDRVINDIQYAVIANSQSPLILKSDQLAAPRRARVFPETVDCILDATADVEWQTLKVTHRRRSKKNGVIHYRDEVVSLFR